MTGASSRWIGALLLALALMYLALFVPRGWIPHDEGTLGQAAERVLRGEIPHVDYQDTYTGGLSWMYAMVFRFAGIDLLYLRWLLFAGASLAMVAMYAVVRRYLTPIPAALTTWVGLTWSFPNYFAGLPSWWLLVCALCCLWAFIRYVETERIAYIALAGLIAGLSILFKQTGVYLVVALVISLLYERGTGPRRFLRMAAGLASLALVLAIMRSQFAMAEMLYLLLPIAACARQLFTGEGKRSPMAPLAVAIAAAMAPLALFAVPYLLRGQGEALVHGLYVLPQKRLVFSERPMGPAYFILTGLPLVALVMPFPRLTKATANHHRLLAFGCGGAAIAATAISMYDARVYQLVWESARAFASLVVIAICWMLMSGRVDDARQRQILFGCAAMLAWAALVQFPFAPPIYFAYVTPLAVIAAVAAAANASALERPALKAWAALLLLVGVLIMNRGYVFYLGSAIRPQTYNSELNLQRAHLMVSDAEARSYQRLVALVEEHIGEGRLVAAPDCPEVYFLVGRFSPTGVLFEFFSDEPLPLATANVVVVNRAPQFSPQLPSELIAAVRRELPHGEFVGRYEVRWR